MNIPTNDWTRNDLAEALALLDGVVLQRINSTVGPEDDANNWRRYLGEADDVLAHLSLCEATNLPASPPHVNETPETEQAGDGMEAAARKIAENHWPVDFNGTKEEWVERDWVHHADDARAALRAATPPAPERSKEEVEVKRLEWKDYADWALSESLIGRYSVETIDDLVNALGPSGWASYGHGSIAEAKAVAQAHFDAVILSALEPASLHKGDEPVGIVVVEDDDLRVYWHEGSNVAEGDEWSASYRAINPAKGETE